jgi:threonylcarbamoyladenosine tRNA methylthiotransferase MtaB
MATGFHIENFGCRAARADGEAVSDRLRDAGHCMQQSSEADVVVVNTCSVTAEADRAARAFIRRAHRKNPAAKIVVTGCYAQRAPEELAGLAGVAAVIGNSHKALAPEIILGLTDGASQHPTSELIQILPAQKPERANSEQLAPPQVVVWADDRFAHSFLEESQVVPGAQTRPSLKIQEGCGNRCTFCVIPQTRGGSKSLPAAAVLRQVEGFVAAGGNELVLSGINLGRWGRDAAALSENSAASLPSNLAALVRHVFTQTALPRLRLSSIEPMDWDAELISLMAEFGGTRLARHAHLPLQSGSDAVLRRMHRRYRPWHYVDKVEALLRAAGPQLTLGADVMVGFPGETDAEFEETRALIAALPFGYLHLFPFSPRPGTPGWAMHAEKPVPVSIVDERMSILRALAAEKTKTHRTRHIGQVLDALTLHTPSAIEARGCTVALTENFMPVKIADSLPANRIVRVRATGLNDEGTLLATANGPAQYEATAISVSPKSVPLKSNSSPVSLASA